ncbi:MAG: hypothetical protein IJP16_02030 [Clostridia bacterium]|nr:hypothetical protein [Clostridia bacterium]
MARLCEKLWNWGHLEGSHDHYTKSKNTMTPERFADDFFDACRISRNTCERWEMLKYEEKPVGKRK